MKYWWGNKNPYCSHLRLEVPCIARFQIEFWSCMQREFHNWAGVKLQWKLAKIFIMVKKFNLNFHLAKDDDVFLFIPLKILFRNFTLKKSFMDFSTCSPQGGSILHHIWYSHFNTPKPCSQKNYFVLRSEESVTMTLIWVFLRWPKKIPISKG